MFKQLQSVRTQRDQPAACRMTGYSVHILTAALYAQTPTLSRSSYIMNTLITVVIIVLIALVVGLFFLYRAGMKMQTEQAQNQVMLEKYAQVASLLIIDKKRMPFKEAPFPKEVYETAPRRAKLMKVYVVRAKVGPKVYDLMCDRDTFEDVPVKATIKARVSGMYLMEILQGAVPSERNIKKRKKAKEKAAKQAAKNS